MNEEQKAIAEEIFYMLDQEHIAPVEALNAMAALLQELIDAPEPEPAAETMLIQTAPKAIYLNISEDGDGSKPFPKGLHSDDIGWSEDPATAETVKYIRADLAATAAARLEDHPPPADRAIQPGASDATQSLYTIISDPRGAAGIYETIEDARPHAEITARRSTFGRAAIVTIVAEVAMVPQWEGGA